MGKKMRILHLEDEQLHAAITRSLLTEDGIVYDLARVATETDFVAALADGKMDLILAAFTLPEFDGMTALAMTRARFPDLPFIFVSATMGEEAVIAAFKQGATDYVIKGRLSRLAPAVRQALSVAEARSEQRKAEEALRCSEEELRHSNEMYRQSERKFRTAFEDAAVGMCLTGLDDRFLDVNHVLCTMLGYAAAELTGMDCLGLTHPDDQEKCRAWASAICAGESQDSQMEKRFISRDGRIVWATVSKALLRDDNGTPLYFIDQVQEITELKNLENQLRHAQKMEAIGTLAGGIAHDFNNILTAISGYGSLLEMRLDQQDPLRPFVQHILTAADRAASLTKSLLTFGRKQVLESCIVDLNQLIQRTEPLLLRLLREDVELQTTLANVPCMIMADAGQIEQVLMNLTANARDAMPEGGRLAIATSLTNIDREFVTTHGYGAPGRFVLLTVSDSGFGMDIETSTRIFEPFFTTKEVGKGTGLGLSMAYGIVKQHQGFINCYSEPGEGTTFRIYLPVVNALVEPVTADPIDLPLGGTETILFAEDDEQVRLLTSSLLERFGYTVITARDGKDALGQFYAYRDTIQLVLLDVIMPGKNGRAVYEEMKRTVPELKALFTSGYSADIFRRGELEEPGFAFISKPARPAELLKKIRQVLDEVN